MNISHSESLPLEPRPGPRVAVLFGGAGFIGRYTALLLAQKGWHVRVVSRSPNQEWLSKDSSQLEVLAVNTADVAKVKAAVKGAMAVVNLTGILSQSKSQNFEAVHHQGARIIACAAKQEGIEKFVQISAIGASLLASSAYARSKAAGEAAVLEIIPSAVILRPSIVFGREDNFFNRFAKMARFSPALPLIGGGNTLFQPIYVEDVAAAIVGALEGKTKAGKTFELGGPERRSFKELLSYIVTTTRRKRALLPLPFPLAHVVAGAIEIIDGLSFGLMPKIFLITRDQVKSLQTNNVVSEEALKNSLTVQAFGIEPRSIETIVPSYLR